ncbi:hypothetical protein MKEN_00789400 [Mycena kentingensis (nom. inval.)]|nr:hypothetical protein MKEN_00789400 [Mycena kentingensis (nom. inval.)]
MPLLGQDELRLVCDFLDPPHILSIACTCQAYRNILLASPAHWARVWLKTERDLTSAPYFVERSGSCALDVSISSTLFDAVVANPNPLSPDRWRTLLVLAYVDVHIRNFIAEISASTPNLVRLEFLACERVECFEHTPLFQLPALRSLVVHACVPCIPALPNLTYLYFFRLQANYHQFRQLILDLPVLETLVLDQFADELDRTFDASYPLIEAASITSLSVNFTNDYLTTDNEKTILTFLYTPNLQYLEIWDNREDYGEFSGKQYSFLQTLCLHDMEFDDVACSVYRAFENLTRLEIHKCRNLEFLLTGAEESWPSLQTFVCDPPTGAPVLLLARPQIKVQAPKRLQEELQGDPRVQFYSSSDEAGTLLHPDRFARKNWDSLDDRESFSGGSFEDDFDLDYELDYADEYDDEEDYEDGGYDDYDEGFEDEDVDAW